MNYKRNKELTGLRRISSNNSEEVEDIIEGVDHDLNENIGKQLIEQEKVEIGNVIITYHLSFFKILKIIFIISIRLNHLFS
jgi:hypothetical protein